MRVFLGIPVTDNIRKESSKVIEKIKAGGIKTVKPENLHFTAKFFGEKNVDEIERIKEKMEKIKTRKIKISVKGIGFFPSKSYIKTIWLGVEKGGKELTNLLEGIQKLFPGESKKTVPHITIGRVRFLKNREEFIENTQKIGKIGEMEIDRITLYQSLLKPEGPIYKKIKTMVW